MISPKWFIGLLLLALLGSACGPAPLKEVPTAAAALDEKSESEVQPTHETSPAATFPPVDILFEIDCSAVDPAKQPDCDDFIAQTADLVYRRLVQFTGVTLANCYKVVTYTIIPNDPSQVAGGYTTENAITFMDVYSIDSNLPYDVHELIHSFSWCTGALDSHIFHGALMNAVYFSLGQPEFSQYPTEQDTRDEFDRIVAALATTPVADRYDLCTGALSDLVTIAGFQLGDGILPHLYQSTIAAAPLTTPSELATTVWGGWDQKAQALVDALAAETGAAVQLPDCGF